MNERKKAISPLQTFFFEQSGRVQLSTSIQSMPFGELVENFLVERSLWKEARKGDWILFDPKDRKIIPFTREGRQLGPVFDDSDEDKNGKFAGAIVVFQLGLLTSDQSKAKDSLINVSSFLKKEGTVFVLEAKYQDQDREWRKQILKEVGFVKANVLVSQEGYLVWEARFHKEHKERPGVDLTSPTDPVRYRRMQKLWKDMVESYQLKGFTVVKNEPLLSRLRSSKFIPQDVGYLKDGLGVTLRSRCGCVWEVPFKHEWERVEHCPDMDCDGIPANPQAIYHMDAYNVSPSKCYDCRDEGATKQIIYRIEKMKRNGTARLLEITFCPHCGMKNSITRHLNVLQSQIKFGY